MNHSAMTRATICLAFLLVTTCAKATPMAEGAGTGAVSMAQEQGAPIPFVDRPAASGGQTSLDMPTQAPINSPSEPAMQPRTSAPTQLSAAPSDANELRITGLGGGSAQWTIVILLTFLTLIPSILICMTPFARLLIVFHFLRQALGLQTTPSNQTLIGLSVIMTFFLMQPIGVTIYHDSVVPLQAGKITALDAVARAGIPMRQFMSHYVREKDVALFLEMAKEPRPASIDDVSFRVLLPAYILSELKAGFQIGAVLFLPFLVVDMVVASITTSVGMMQLPPVVISTPLKLLLFLMVDGWHLLIGALMRSFN
jgi:flagellar biosynthetic protein FliP